jgi:GNAT superfamily N-acetyltransferase
MVRVCILKDVYLSLILQHRIKAMPMQLSRSRIRRLFQTLAVEDWRILFESAVLKLSHPLFNVYYILEFDLARAHELPPAPLPAGITVRLFRGQGEISPFATLLVEAGTPAAILEERMRRGDLVALALTDDGELAGYAWTTYTDAWIPEVHAGLSLRSDEVVGFDTLVMPKWRGRGLQYPLTVPLFRYLSEQGYRRSLHWVNALNKRSLKNQRRQGKRKIATIVSSPLLGIARLRDIAPEAGITFEKKKPSLATMAS